jgi:hypothetical protein
MPHDPNAMVAVSPIQAMVITPAMHATTIANAAVRKRIEKLMLKSIGAHRTYERTKINPARLPRHMSGAFSNTYMTPEDALTGIPYVDDRQIARRMGGAKRYPSIAIHASMGFA